MSPPVPGEHVRSGAPVVSGHAEGETGSGFVQDCVSGSDPVRPVSLQRLSTANDEIVEVLLSKQQVLGALRFIRSVGTITF